MAEILSGYQLSQGKKFKNTQGSYLNMMMPLQMIPYDQKDDDWVAQTMNFIEWQGIKQLSRNLNWMVKNFNLDNEIIDRSDYIREESEYKDIIDRTTAGEIDAMSLKFYSFAPIVLNTLCNEFAVRPSKITFSLNDEISSNEMLEDKKGDVEQVLLQQLALKQQIKMQQLGIAPDSDEAKQMMDPQAIKSLPEIQQFYTKSYKSIYQDWAEHQMHYDEDRFSMPELERRAFRNMLVVDRCFMELQMMQNDYKVNGWNPIQTFYRKTPNERWISKGQWVGKVDLMTVPSVIDSYGAMMTEEQFTLLNTLFPAGNMNYIIDGTHPNDYYDASKSYDWNRTGPGLATRQLMTMISSFGGMNGYSSGDIANQLFANTEDMQDYNFNQLVRVSTIYWKTQRKMGALSKIDEQGNLVRDIVSEGYRITDKPLYNTVLYKQKTANNLIFGEHIDWYWINETWGGIKIGPNLPVYSQFSDNTGFTPIYIGMNGGKPGRLPFQFRRDDELWDSSLPVEGSIFSDYNSKSRSLLDKLKPWQIGYNLMGNQIMDLNIDELGIIVAFNQNIIPKHTLGEDWGKNNIAKAYSVMKDFSMLPFDTSRQNTDDPIGGPGIQVLDATQTQRILAKAKLMEWFKEQGLSAVGMNPNRLGSPVDREETATGIQQGVAASYAQTEHYFIQFSDEFMPRFHQMRTDVAQFYASTNPSIRLQYTSSNEEKVNFQINGTKLLGRDFGVMCKSRANARNVLKDIKQLLLTNNTSGANLFDLVRGIKIDNLSEMDDLMRSIETRAQQQEQQKMQQEKQMHDEMLQQQMAIHEDNQQQERDLQEMKNRSAETVAEIRAASSINLDTTGEDYQNYLAEMERIQGQQNNTRKMDLEEQKHITKTAIEKKGLDIRQQEVNAENSRTSAMMKQKAIEQKIKEKAAKKKK